MVAGAGDVLNIMPRNYPTAVREFCSLMQIDPLQTVRLIMEESVGEEISQHIAFANIRQPCTIGEIVATHFDILGIPRRSFFSRLVPLATHERERERLEFFASPEGSEDRVQYTFREKRSIMMIFRDFASVRPSFDQLFAIMPRLKPRAFSIASSPTQHRGRVHVCVSVVQYTTPLRRVRHGVCSTFLSLAEPGDIIPCWVTEGTFKFDFLRPGFEVPPMILVGPGTGLAPFRSLLGELSARSTPNIHLFFGCRHAVNGDLLYQAELEEWNQKDGCNLYIAFSRDQGEKIYVQDLMRNCCQELCSVLNHPDGRVYVAGSRGAMPQSVRNALGACLVSQQGMTAEEAELHLARMGARYQVESW